LFRVTGEGTVRIVIAVRPARPQVWIESFLTGFPPVDPVDIVVVSALAMPCPPLTSPGPAAARLYGAAAAALRAEAADAARLAVETVGTCLAGRVARVAARVSAERPAEAILHAAAAWDADLIVIGPATAGPVRRAFLGSVPDDVVRGAGCPVLVAKRSLTELRRVLVATDGSLHAEAAIRFLLRLPVPRSANLRVSAVSETRPGRWLPGIPVRVGGSARFAEIERRAASGAIAAAQAALAALHCPVQSSLREGEAAHELAQEVDGWRPDLVVLGARGRTAGPEVSLGRVAEALLRGAPCPTLVVRA
jgi:nucleotide-binding universal stress UspA family protein